MKKTLLCFMLFFTALTCYAQAGWQWGRMGFASEGYACATDNSGNAYGLGDMGIFEEILGTDTLNKTWGAQALYVVKYDGNGNVLWARSTENGFASPIAIETDLYEHVYVVGTYEDSVSLGAFHMHTDTSAGEQYFIAKLDASGDIVWAKNLGDVHCLGWYNADIALDKRGNIVVACDYTNNSVLGGFPLVNRDPSLVTSDLVVAKLDSSGNVMWAKTYGGNRRDVPEGIAVSPEMNIYLAVNFESDTLQIGSTAMILDPGVASWDYSDLCVAKMDSNGNALWVEQAYAGGQEGNFITGIACDAYDRAYLFGNYVDTNFQFGGLTLPYNQNADYDCFVAALEPDGSAWWLKRLTGRQFQPINIDFDDCTGSLWIAAGVSRGSGADTIDGRRCVIPPGTQDGLLLAGWRADSAMIGITILQSGGDDEAGLAVNDSGNLFVFADIYSNDTMIVAADTMITSATDENFLMAKYYTGVACAGHDTGAGGTTLVAAVKEDGVIIYPNPATNQLTIQSADHPINEIIIANLLGQVVYSQRACNAARLSIMDVGQLRPGVYFLKINDSIMRKFVKE